MQKLRRRKFGEMLIADGHINRDHVDQALEVQSQTGENLGEILVREGLITEADIIRVVCTQYQLPFIRPAHYEFETPLIDQFGAEFLAVNRCLPLETLGNSVIVAISEIPSEKVEAEIRDAMGKDLFFYLSPATDLTEIIRTHFKLNQEQMLAFDAARRGRKRTVPLEHAGGRGDSTPTQAAPSSPTPATTAGVDSSWESIFDEAEKNV